MDKTGQDTEIGFRRRVEDDGNDDGESSDNEVEALVMDGTHRAALDMTIARSGRRRGVGPCGKLRIIGSCCLVSIVVVLGATLRFGGRPSSREDACPSQKLKSSSSSLPEAVFVCPARDSGDRSDGALNDKSDVFGFYDGTNDEDRNVSNFRKWHFDGWSEDYKHRKDLLRAFKRDYFLPHLQSHNSIYESACGEGLNLAMTLEILQEEGNVTSLQVYGNEYLADSVRVANELFDTVPPAMAKKGQLCQGDSAHLDFVPSHSFDLVFTGYIDPVVDPLDLSPPNASLHQMAKVTKRLCLTDADLAAQQQQAQQDWYASWVTQMIRIAKPGAPVIVESVSIPLCDNFNDWGGVAREWWTDPQTHALYQWDIQAQQEGDIQIVQDRASRKRYHVVLLKKNCSSSSV